MFVSFVYECSIDCLPFDRGSRVDVGCDVLLVQQQQQTAVAALHDDMVSGLFGEELVARERHQKDRTHL